MGDIPVLYPQEEDREPAYPKNWFDVWKIALTQASRFNYLCLLADPKASSKRAYIWIFVSGTISFLTTIGLFLFFQQFRFGITTDLWTFTTTILIIGTPFVGGLSIISAIITIGMVQWVANRFGGEGQFDQLLYLFAAIISPIGIICSVVIVIPVLNLLVFTISFFVMILLLIAIKAINKFSWGKSIAAFFSALMIGVLGIGILFFFSLLAF